MGFWANLFCKKAKTVVNTVGEVTAPKIENLTETTVKKVKYLDPMDSIANGLERVKAYFEVIPGAKATIKKGKDIFTGEINSVTRTYPLKDGGTLNIKLHSNGKGRSNLMISTADSTKYENTAGRISSINVNRDFIYNKDSLTNSYIFNRNVTLAKQNLSTKNGKTVDTEWITSKRTNVLNRIPMGLFKKITV